MLQYYSYGGMSNMFLFWLIFCTNWPIIYIDTLLSSKAITMPNQDMLFPILPRPTPPVNLNDIVHHDVPRVKSRRKHTKLIQSNIIPQQQSHGHHTEFHSQDETAEKEEDAEKLNYTG